MHLEPGITGSCRRGSRQHVQSHPLESNQNLSGFSRARRPTTQEWVRAPRAFAARAAQIIIIVLRLSESGGARRTSGLHASAFAAGAPRASMQPPLTRAHLSRFEISIRDHESQNQSLCCVRAMAGPKRQRAARFPWGGPSAQLRAGVHVNRVRDLRRYPYPDQMARSSGRSHEATWASTRPPRRVPFDRDDVVSARRCSLED